MRCPPSSSAKPVASRSFSPSTIIESPSPSLQSRSVSSQPLASSFGPATSSTTASSPAADAVHATRTTSPARNLGVIPRSVNRFPVVPTGGWYKPSRESRQSAAGRRGWRGSCPSEADGRQRWSARTATSLRRASPRQAAATARWSRSTRPAAAARGATLFVTLEPCAHHGTTPPCADRDDRRRHRARRHRCPRPEPRGRRRDRGARGGRRRGASWSTRWEARRAERGVARSGSRDGGRSSPTRSPPSLDGRVVVPGRRWVSGEESRRLVHELRAASDAVAVGMGTVRADAPSLDARDVPVASWTAAPARLRPRPAARRISARAALGPARGRAARPRRRRRPVAPARGRPDPRRRVPRGAASSTRSCSSSRPCSPEGTGRTLLPRLASRSTSPT